MVAASEFAAHPRRSGTRARVAWAVVMAVGAFLALGSLYDLVSAARRQLPSDHVATFIALTGISWQDAAAADKPTAPYIGLMEVDYAIYELLFATLFLVVAAIPLRRGERWAWWCCWLIVAPELTFAALFGAHDATNMLVAIGVVFMAAMALLVVRPAREGLRNPA